MTDALADVPSADEEPDQRPLAQQLSAETKDRGRSWSAGAGLLDQLAKRVLGTALAEEMAKHFAMASTTRSGGIPQLPPGDCHLTPEHGA